MTERRSNYHIREIPNPAGEQIHTRLASLKKARDKGQITEADFARFTLKTIDIKNPNWRLRMLREEYGHSKKS